MTPFLYQVAKDLQQRFGDDIKDLAVVFNNKRPIVFLQKYFAETYAKPVWGPDFFTVQDFFALSTDQVIADDIYRFFLLHEAYNELLAKENKPPLTQDEFFGLSEIILHDFDQIDYDLVDPKSLFRYLKDTAEIELQFSGLSLDQQQFLSRFWSSFSEESQMVAQKKFIELWARLPLLYDLFNAKMQARGLTATARVYRNLAEGSADHPGFMDSYRKVVFVGFNALNKCEATLFKDWQQAGRTLFYFDADNYYFEDPIQEAGLFLRRNIRDYGLENALGKFPERIVQKQKEINIYPVVGNIAQAKALAEVYKNNPVERFADPIRQALILADESLLVPVLQTVPDDIRLNVTMGYPLKQSPVFGFVDLWLSIQQSLEHSSKGNVLKADAIAFLAHPFLGLPQETAGAAIGQILAFSAKEIPVSILNGVDETIAFKKQARAVDIIDCLDKVMLSVISRKEERKSLYLIESTLLVRVHEALNQLHDGISEYAEGLSPDLAAVFIRKALSALIAPLEGEPLQGLQIMGMLESRCLDFEEVVILGANEGVLPGHSPSPTFIPDALRRAFGLPVIENQEALSAYLFYRLFQYSRKVSIIYNTIVDNQSSGELSRFVRQLQFESGLEINIFPQSQEVALARSASRPLIIEKTPEVMAVLRQYLDPGRYGKKLSASALKLYLQCPLQFFFKYIAGVKEPEKGLGPLQPVIMGKAFHKVMEDFYLEFKDQKVTADAIINKMKILPRQCLEALSFSLFNDQDKLQKSDLDSTQIIALSVLEENARLVLNHDAEQVAPFTIRELENDEEYVYRFPIAVEGEEQEVNLYAIIDRVDEVKGNRRIVDYKTGNDSLEFNNIESLFSMEKTGNMAVFQILFYCLVYQGVKGLDVMPHLYILRKLRETGSSPGQLKAKTFTPYPDDVLSMLLPEFEQGLKSLLEEIFDPATPFRHNAKGTHYDSGPYDFLCKAGVGAVADADPEVDSAEG